MTTDNVKLITADSEHEQLASRYVEGDMRWTQLFGILITACFHSKLYSLYTL